MRAALLALLFAAVLTVDYPPGPWPAHLFRAAVFALGAVWLARALLRREPIAWHWALAPALGLAAWPWVQLAAGLSAYPAATAAAGAAWGANAMLFFLALQFFPRGSESARARQAMLYFGFALSVLSVMQYFTSEGRVFWIFETEYKDQVAGPFVSRDHYSAFIELVLPLAVVGALRERKRAAAYAVMASAMFASVIAGASRAGAILVTLEVLALLVPPALAGAARRPAWMAFGRVAALAAVFTLVVGWEVLWQRFQDPDPYRYRREMAISALEMAAERPFTGFGAGTFEFVYPAYASFDLGLHVPHAHNDWAEWAAEGGFPFAALMLALAGWVVWRVRGAPWAIGVVAVLMHSLVDFPMQKTPVAAWLFAMMGMLAASRAAVKRPDASQANAAG
jgi:O-antigen ligase